MGNTSFETPHSNLFGSRRQRTLQHVCFMSFFPTFQADLLSQDPQHSEEFRDALTNIDEHIQEIYKKVDSDNNGHIDPHEFKYGHDEF